MNTIMVNDEYGYPTMTEDDSIVSPMISSLCYNNTFCPNITKCYLSRDVERRIFDPKTTKKIKVKRDILRVSFADGSWTEVVRNPEDPEDFTVGIIYAIAKRVFGTYNDNGYVSGNFMKKIKEIASKTITPESEAKAKSERIKAKFESDKKAHEDSVARKNKNPSIGIRIRNLEDKFNKLLDKLSK